MIDLHNHILPGLDDGAAELEESLEIARQFVSEGVTMVAATPHRNPSRRSGQSRTVVERLVAELQTALDQAGIPLALTTGHELYLTPDALPELEAGDICTLGGTRTALVELPFDVRPVYLDETLFRLQLARFQVVLAHPERYRYVQRDSSFVEPLVERGVALQVTAPSLLGEYGPGVQRTAEALVRRGLCSLAASDRHHPGLQRSLAAAHERIASLTDAERADLLLIDNPQRIVRGEDVLQPEVRPAQNDGLSARLRRHFSTDS